MMERALLGAIAAALITAYARRMGTLDESGQWGAMGCGVLAAWSGWPWAILLVTYFVVASAVTMYGAARKAAHTQASVPQLNARTALQVLAKGGLFALLVFRARGNANGTFGLAAVGALAAASADTWATEIGTLWGGKPRSIITWRPTNPGVSGGVTAAGLAAAVFGAAIVAVVAAALFDLPLAGDFVIAATVGGIAGCIVDSLIGGTMQARRWCEHCKEWTERRVHPCSYRTVHAAGFRWMSNDLVNFAATFAGAATAVATRIALR